MKGDGKIFFKPFSFRKKSVFGKETKLHRLFWLEFRYKQRGKWGTPEIKNDMNNETRDFNRVGQ